ncbi:MAG: PadR family transcriptional regulator [Chloroflexota bacterium]|nr:PadR family transcriptional regulator [Chloroflexota bacterium]
MFEKRRFFKGHWDGSYNYEYSYKYSHFGKGDLKYVILDLIKDKPRYGYEIIRVLEERSMGLYKPSAGAVYPTLQMLEDMGYATCSQQDGKKVYTITDEGRRFLDERKGTADEIFDQMRRHWNPSNIGTVAEALADFAKLGSIIKRRARDINPDKLRRVREAISKACDDIEKILEE